MRPCRAWCLVIAVLVAIGCSAPPGVEHEFVIPAGTGARLDARLPVEVLPPILEVRVGDSLTIQNLDDRGHRIGPYYVGAGETLTQTFRSPAEMRGPCTVRPDEEIVLRVRA